MKTARQIADQVEVAKQKSSDETDTAMLAMDSVSDADAAALRTAAEREGYRGDELDRVSEHAEQLLVGKAQAMADDMPATGAD